MYFDYKSLAEDFKLYKRKTKQTGAEIAKKLGISRAALYRCIGGKHKNIRPAFMDKILNLMNLDVKDYVCSDKTSLSKITVQQFSPENFPEHLDRASSNHDFGSTVFNVYKMIYNKFNPAPKYGSIMLTFYTLRRAEILISVSLRCVIRLSIKLGKDSKIYSAIDMFNPSISIDRPVLLDSAFGELVKSTITTLYNIYKRETIKYL